MVEGQYCESVNHNIVSILDAASPRHLLETEPEHRPVAEGRGGATGEASVSMCKGPAMNQLIHGDAKSPRHPLETEPEHQPVAEGQVGATGEASVGMCKGLALNGMQGPPSL